MLACVFIRAEVDRIGEMRKVWGYDTDADTNVVWVYLSYIRKKLTSLQANVQIKAARNQGYFLEVGK